MHLKMYDEVHFFEPPFASLFKCYLGAFDRKVEIIKGSVGGNPSPLPFGVFVQILLTILFVPLLMLMRRKILVSTGDKFETGRDHDFRMRFIYESLREKKLPFIEFVRSLEPSHIILKHAYTRRRPVIYTEAVVFIGRFLSILTLGHWRARKAFGPSVLTPINDPELRFKLAVATQYLLTVYDDVISIRIMKWITRAIGVRAAIIPATTERNFHTVLGCKLNKIPTVGILHGVASRHYNLYEFMQGFRGEKRLSVDRYGVWSKWWQEYFEKYSDAYATDQVFVSGPMRPIQNLNREPVVEAAPSGGRLRVLFVSEVVAIPEEVIPYLEVLLSTKDFDLYIKFRDTHDSFEAWLENHRPDILKAVGPQRILKGTMHEAIKSCDITVGCQSTGVIEAVNLDKPFVFFQTKKWGDYFDMKTFDPKHRLFAENPTDLLAVIRESKNIPKEVLGEIRNKFFGDPHMNGSAWVVNQVEHYVNLA
jgi:hypothetical protein